MEYKFWKQKNKIRFHEEYSRKIFAGLARTIELESLIIVAPFLLKRGVVYVFELNFPFLSAPAIIKGEMRNWKKTVGGYEVNILIVSDLPKRIKVDLQLAIDRQSGIMAEDQGKLEELLAGPKPLVTVLGDETTESRIRVAVGGCAEVQRFDDVIGIRQANGSVKTIVVESSCAREFLASNFDLESLVPIHVFANAFRCEQVKELARAGLNRLLLSEMSDSFILQRLQQAAPALNGANNCGR